VRAVCPVCDLQDSLSNAEALHMLYLCFFPDHCGIDCAVHNVSASFQKPTIQLHRHLCFRTVIVHIRELSSFVEISLEFLY